MKIIVIGATGTLGRAVVTELGQDNEVISVGLTHSDLQVDLTRDESVEALFAQTGRADAIMATTGSLFFGPLTAMRAEDFAFGLNDKLLGQVRLSLIGQHYLNDGGSITLTSGIIGSEPIAQGVNATAVNAALEGFVRAAACELPRGLRINVVSPTVLSESVEKYGAFFPGFESVPAARAALAYRRSVYGVQTGRTFTVGY
ncbi:short chain dehydrogenase [Kosakonia cowanii]|jgi:NAD(P)-dependent dehydrogenase (short-subunit alcohol dehydrogenase family)|uniref:short chain dehydrogenase n=1 Tax=Kosakonia cowanii TaxID=208223 RepID=UPI001F5AB691|nr:short chain dehydrogenase [Kosakonia cowanii]